MTAESNCTRRCCCAGGKFQERRSNFAPVCCSVRCSQRNDLRRISGGDILLHRGFGGQGGYHSVRTANLQCRIALLRSDGLVERQNHQLLAQTGDENRRPIFVVGNLHGHDRSRSELVHFRFETTCVLFNITKAAGDPASGIENGSRIAFARDGLLPCYGQEAD